MYTFAVDVPKAHSLTIQSFLDSQGVEHFWVLREAIDGPQTIIVVAASLTIARQLYFFVKELRKSKAPDVEIHITVYNELLLGKTEHQIASEQELRDAIAEYSSNNSAHVT